MRPPCFIFGRTARAPCLRGPVSSTLDVVNCVRRPYLFVHRRRLLLGGRQHAWLARFRQSHLALTLAASSQEPRTRRCPSGCHAASRPMPFIRSASSSGPRRATRATARRRQRSRASPFAGAHRGQACGQFHLRVAALRTYARGQAARFVSIHPVRLQRRRASVAVRCPIQQGGHHLRAWRAAAAHQQPNAV